MQKIVPFPCYDGRAAEAAKFYASIFKNSKIGNVRCYPDAGAQRVGHVCRIPIARAGLMFTFSPAIALFANCETQQEGDELWEKLFVAGCAEN
jgi:predicted 3-demethylubiquinone-9 3-methyltransferase (glyoxalase superfamily)